MSTQEEKLEIFYQLSKAVAFVSDPHGLERHLVDLLKKLVACNSILVFHNDRNRHKLTARNPYNLSQTDEQSVTLPYEDPLISDVLVLRKSVSRLNPQHPVLPSMKSELFVPLISPDDILGCLYLSRVNAQGFERKDITLLEHAAGHITFALERQEWKRHFRKLEETNLTWQDKYVAFLQAIPYPAAVVDVINDQFDEANDAALELFGASQKQFIQTPFSELCSIKPSEPDASTRMAILKRSNGDREKYTVLETTFVDARHKKSLFIFFPKHAGLDATTEKWLRSFFRQCAASPIPQNLQTDLDALVTQLASQFSANYVTLLGIAPEGKLTPLAAFDFNDKFHKASKQKTKLLQEGVFDHVLQLKKPVYIDDVQNEPAFERWIPIAERLNYRAMASVPLILDNEILALLNVFCPKEQEWEQQALVLNQAASAVATLVKLHVVNRNYTSQEQQHAIVSDLMRLLSCDSDTQEQIQIVAQEFYSYIPFDYFSVTQLNDETGTPRSFVLGTQALRDTLNRGERWEAIDQSPLGWVQAPQSTLAVDDEPEEEKGALPYRLPVSFSVLLMYEENYVGNLALGRLDKHPLTQEERTIVRELGTHLAKALYTQGRLVRSKQKEKHIRSLIDVCLALDYDVKDKDLFQHLTEMVPTYFDVNHFCAQKYYETLTVAELFAFLTESALSSISEVKTHQVFASFADAHEPLCIQSLLDFVNYFCEDLPEHEVSEFQPFVIVPIIHEKRLFAYLTFDWKNELNFADYAEVVIRPLVHHIQQALHNAQLYRDLNKKAEDLELLMSTISHDFKTPIQNLRSFVTMLSDKYGNYLPEEPQKYLLRILTNIDNMEALVEDLLRLYQVGKLQQFNRVKVKDIVEVALNGIDQTVSEHEIKIVTPPEWPVVYGNPSALMQIFANLISNAAKYVIQAPDPRIELGYKQGESFVEFFVKDNGPGINRSLQDKIFELFYKGNDAQNSTGIGLAIVKRAVTSHDGCVWVESREGRGATFKFTIPIPDHPA